MRKTSPNGTDSLGVTHRKKGNCSKSLQAALEICFGNHIYQCKNEVARQVTGGGIGARVTGVVARILMDVWADRLARKLEDNNVLLYMLAKYVDDINLVAQIIPRGFAW